MLQSANNHLNSTVGPTIALIKTNLEDVDEEVHTFSPEVLLLHLLVDYPPFI
jgi:hypothetical protein